MFEAQVDSLNDGRVQRFRLICRAELLSYAEVIEYWQRNDAFRSFFISLLSGAPFAAFRWETPAVTVDSVDRNFEFVLVDNPALERNPDRISFSDYFTDSDVDAGVVAFPNLGKDATLVVPSPRGPAENYGHLATFTRYADSIQNHALWHKVGQAMRGRVSERPVWLNTAGDGISWLHVRLDSQPKYYQFAPYRIFT